MQSVDTTFSDAASLALTQRQPTIITVRCEPEENYEKTSSEETKTTASNKEFFRKTVKTNMNQEIKFC